jgi:hypothetical protein
MTFGEMQQFLHDELGPHSTDAALSRRIRSALNAEYRILRSMRNWAWLQSTGTIALTSATEGSDLPSGTRGIASVNLASNGMELPWRPMKLDAMERGALTYRSRGTPETWDMWGGQLYTSPLPSGSDTLNLQVLLSDTDMVLDADVPLFNADYHQVLVDGALARLTATDVYDRGIQVRAEKNYGRALRALMHTSPPAQPRILNVHWIVGQH